MIPVLFAFYIQDVLKFKCQIPVPKGSTLNMHNLTMTTVHRPPPPPSYQSYKRPLQFLHTVALCYTAGSNTATGDDEQATH
jgi:hypothetical protein